MTVQEKVGRLIDEANSLIKQGVLPSTPVLAVWKDSTAHFLAKRYGASSQELIEFERISFGTERSRPVYGVDEEALKKDKCQMGLIRAKALLERLTEEIDEKPVKDIGKGVGSSASCSPARLPCEFDVCISHAAADKIEIVDALKKGIDQLGVNVWYDSNSIDWGDKWKEKIYEGLDKCRFGIVVMSPKFKGREWTENELNELLSRQNAQKEKIVLPLLYNLMVEEMKKEYPQLGEIQAKTISSKKDVPPVVIEFAKILIKSLKAMDVAMQRQR